MQPSLKQKGLIAVLITIGSPVLLYALNAIAQGVIGNFASDTLFPKVVSLLTMVQWPLLLTPGLFATTLCGGCASLWIYRTKTRELKSTIGIFGDLIAMDDSMFLLMQGMERARSISTDELDKVAKKAIELLLAIATQMFSDEVYSGALFLLDKSSNCLKIWAHYRMIQADVNDVQFDMSLPARPPVGMARASYVSGKPEVGRIEKKGKLWHCTNEHYIKIDTPMESHSTKLTLREYPTPLYLSLICVPVIHPEISQEPLGVIAFHSSKKTTFDNTEINRLVEKIAGRISQALVFYQFLK